MSSFNSSDFPLSGPLYSDVRAIMNTGYFAGFVTILAIWLIQYIQARKRDIAVPAVGPSGRLTSYYGAVKFMGNAQAMLEEGYEKYKSRTFKVPEFRKWLVVVNTPELIDEVRRAPDDKLSFAEAVRDSISSDFTFGRLVIKNKYHIPIIRTRLTRSIPAILSDIKEEITIGFDEGVDASGDAWVSRPVLHLILQVTCRASNRVFVGLPLCRDKDYIALMIRFTTDLAKAAVIAPMVPTFLTGPARELLTSVPADRRRSLQYLGPIIEYRLRQEDMYGREWNGKPNDMLSWLIEEAEGEQRSVMALAQRVLALNFAAVHTSSMSFAHALLHLAARPECISPLREEVECVIQLEGWTKAAMQKMRKVDSFLRESQRYTGIGKVAMLRKAVVDYTLSDGTFLPAGSTVACNSFVVQHDDANYNNAREFQPFRFADASEEGFEENSRHQLVSTSLDYLPFGYGRHACPGRFFAANEMKTMMAYLVLMYDIKLPEGRQQRPKDLDFSLSTVPDPKAHILFRRRQT